MRGADITQVDLFSYRTLEERITAEREAAKTMMDSLDQKKQATLGADKWYDVHRFVQAVRDRGLPPT